MPNPQTPTAATLERLAGQVAEKLVTRALQDMALGLPPFPMTITIEAAPAAPAPQKLLGTGRTKPGPKPGTRRAKKFQPPTAVAERLRQVADRLKATRTEAPSGLKATTDLTLRQCRKCFKKGTAQPLGDGQAQCSSCGHRWTLRRSKLEAVSPAPQKRPTAKADAGDCTRCDHPLAKHVEFTGACLTPRCVCAEAVS